MLTLVEYFFDILTLQCAENPGYNLVGLVVICNIWTCSCINCMLYRGMALPDYAQVELHRAFACEYECTSSSQVRKEDLLIPGSQQG